MPARFVTHSLSIIIFVLIIFTVFATVWARPVVGITLGLILFLFVLIATSYMIVKKYRAAYHSGNIPLYTSIRNICLEIAAILLAMMLAGLIGRYLSVMAVGEIANHPAKLIVGLGICLLAGWAVGLFVKRTCSRLVKIPSGS